MGQIYGMRFFQHDFHNFAILLYVLQNTINFKFSG